MNREIREILPELVKEIHELILDDTDDKELKMKKKQLIGEAAISFNKFSNATFIVPHEKVLMERAFLKAYYLLYDSEALFYFSSFYYAYRNIKDKDLFEQQKTLIKTNLDTMAMLLKVLAVRNNYASLGTSLDNCFFERLERCIWVFTVQHIP